MTTTTLTGFTVFWEDDTNFEAYTTGFEADFEFTLTHDAGAGLTYQYDGEDFYVSVDETGYYAFYFNGANAGDLDVDASVIAVSWQENGQTYNATVLELSYVTGTNSFGGLTGTDHYVVLDSDSIVDLNSLADWSAFNDAITGVSEASGDYGPGQFIDWTQTTSYVSTTEVDEFAGTEYDDYVNTGAGDDEVYSSAGNDTMDGGADFDELHYRDDPGGVVVDLDAGTATDGYGDTDTISNFELVRGSMYDDLLLGNADKNQFRGLAGNDTIKGGGSTDKVRYDKDADHGGTNGVTVNLKSGTATDGFGDTDTLAKIENVLGSEFDDDITGSSDNNTLEGGAGRDTMDGGKGSDVVLGGGDKDQLKGGNGSDTLEGGDGNDNLNGGKGKDRVKGDAGKDTINGGDGNDKLTGGKKSDTFVFKNDFGKDKITDFKATDNKEKIDLSAVGTITGFNDLSNNHMTQVGDDVVIDALDGNQITLLDVDISDLGKADFIF